MNSYPTQRRPQRPASRLSSCRGRLVGVLLLVAGAAISGCRQSEDIQTYIVSKEAPPPSAAMAASGEPTDRMLAAILPAGQQAWFLKVVGPLQAVDAAAPEVEKFFASVRPAAGTAPPEWKLPDGWTEQQGTGMRAATITIPADGASLELSVIGLPWSGGPSELLENVNRWRGQLQLAPTDIAGLADCTRPIEVGDATLTVVDLRGQFKSSGMSAPFAGSGMGGPMAGGGMMGGGVMAGPMTDSSAGMPAGHPPIGAGNDEVKLQYKTPDAWQEQPASGMRKASFEITDGDRQAQVAVFDFPDTAGPAISDPLANVNRWRGEVGLEPLSQEALADDIEEVAIGGQPGTYVAALPEAASDDADQPQRGTLAAMVVDGHRIWFFKLSGDPELVASQKDAFRSFLDSIQFATGEGADDGN